MMKTLFLAALLASCPAAANDSGATSLSSLFKSITAFLNGPARRAPRVAAVAAVRGGIPTDQGEDLDQRLLDRARALRAALLRPDPAAADASALAPVYEALAASEYVQALAVAGRPKTEAASLLSSWASSDRVPPLPDAVKALMTGPAAAVDDKALVAAGWGDYVRGLSPSDSRPAQAAPGWSAAAETARLDEDLQSVRDALLNEKLSPAVAARAHVLAGRLLTALAAADLNGRVDEASAASSSPAAPAVVADEGPPPAPAAEVAFNPKKIYARASKSVALILCASDEGSGELGTGSVVDADKNLILTNAHVVIREASREPWPVIHVYFKPARMTGDTRQDMKDPVEGRVVAFDRALDLALVQVPSLPRGAGAIPLDDPRGVEVGDRVAAIGHPEQGGLWTLTTGVISTVVADVGGVKGKDAFQTDTSINRGNSGGPLLDASGHIVGVNTSMARKAADGLAITSVNFALRSDVAHRWMAAQKELIAYAAPPRAAVAAAEPPPAPAPALAAPVQAPAAPSSEPPAAVVAAAPPPAPAPAPAPAPSAAPADETKRVTITESKPYDRDALIAAEIAKMEQMGDEMQEEIRRKSGR